MQFTHVTYPLSNLIGAIEQGTIGLPEIQRPFVWKPVQVRDLFDSMYQGFPVGFLLFWKNMIVAGARPIGAENKQLPAQMLVVDGQQRLTSLYAVMRGQPIINDDFKKVRLQIAFRPRDERFDVTSAAIRNDAEWIPDIGEVWSEGLITFVAGYVDRLRGSRQVSGEEERRIGEAIQQLQSIESFQFTALELAADLDAEQVAEIFVRVNSKAVKLNQADFILTLMSVWWDKGRKELEGFCRDTRLPSVSGASPFNWFIQPSPDQLLRTSVVLAFGRARLQHVYSILRGKDLESGEFSVERREQQFENLRLAQEDVLDLKNWHEFFTAISGAGYRGGRMIMSETNLMYSYATFLIGLKTFGVDKKSLRRVIARWFFMTSITSRYTGSSETQMESDLARLSRVESSDAFVAELDRICDSELTNDFWDIRLPNDLERSGTRSPMLYAFEASLVLLGANALFSTASVTDLIDPAITGTKNHVERHHLFPKAYLIAQGIKKTSEINQLANYALVEWAENISIGAFPPNDYYASATAHLDEGAIRLMESIHALPTGWQQMGYWDFLAARRELMAQVMHTAWDTLSSDAQSEEPVSEAPRGTSQWAIGELLARKESASIEFKSSARWSYHRGEKGKEIEDAVVKTIAAFMNTRGGTLVIGVNDDGHALGLERDFSTVRGANSDGFDQWIHRLLGDAIGVPEVANLVSVTFGDVDDFVVCRVDVRPGQREVYATTSVDDGAFFVRTGAATRNLTTAEATSYIKDHWRGGHAVILQEPPPVPESDPAPPISTELDASALGNDKNGGFDWAPTHALLSALPDGRWTTYGDVAALVGTAAQPLGTHLMRCQDCVNEHRVLTATGEVSEDFSWGDGSDKADPRQLLVEEGIGFDDQDRADPAKRLSQSDLVRLFEELNHTPTTARVGTKTALYEEFWTRYLERLRSDHPDWSGERTPSNQNWMDFPSPLKGTRLNPSFAQGERLRHEIHIDTGDKTRNKSIFGHLARQRELFEAEYGRPLQWEEMPNARASRIADYRPDADVTFEDRHDEFIDWFLDAGVRLRRALAEIAPVTEATSIESASGGSVAAPANRERQYSSIALLGRELAKHGLRDSNAKSYVRLFPVHNECWATVKIRSRRVILHIGSTADVDADAVAEDLGADWVAIGRGLYRTVSHEVDRYAVRPEAVESIAARVADLRDEIRQAIDVLSATVVTEADGSID